MKNKTFLTLLAVIIVITLGFSVFVGVNRKKIDSFSEYIESKEYSLNVIEPFSKIENANEDTEYIIMSTSFKEAIDKADLAIIAEYTGKSNFTDEYLYLYLNVSEVIKGELDSDTITLVKPFYFNTSSEYLEISISDGIVNPELGEKYFLMIEPIKNKFNFSFPDELYNAYTVDSIFDMYKISGAEQDFYYTDQLEDIKSLEDIKPNTQVFATSKENLQYYNTERKAAIDYYKSIR